MIHFEQVAEPPEFDSKARKPGNAWLKDNPGAKRPRDYWSSFKPQLAEGFGILCGYTVMYEPVGTVDHFVPCDPQKGNADLAYEWSNYRFAAAWINSSKKNADNVLDPFEVQDDWFEILLPSLQLVLTDNVPSEYQAKAEYTLTLLHLRDDERVLRQRREWYRMYQDGELTIDGLRRKAPLIARAVE